MKFIITILNQEKKKKILQLANLPNQPNIKVTKKNDKVIFETSNKHYNKIPRESVERFIPLLLKGRGCVIDIDYTLTIIEEEFR